MSDTFAPTPVYAEPERGLGVGIRAFRASDNIILRRWFGCWIDFIAMGVIFLVSALILNRLPDAIGFTIMCIAILAYFPVTEGLWGRSLGKFVSGTIVVDADGNKAGWGAAIIRTLARLLEVNPFLLGGLPAGLIALMTKNRQRLGDIIARTYVVPVKTLDEVRAKMAKRELEVFD